MTLRSAPFMISSAKKASKGVAARPQKQAAAFPALSPAPASLEVQRLRSRLVGQVRSAGQTLLPRILGRFLSTSSLSLSLSVPLTNCKLQANIR